MSELTEISLVRCPYCHNEWVREDNELVCKNCEPKKNVDLAVADLISSLDTLEQEKLEYVENRIDLLISIHQKLTTLIKKAKQCG